MKKNLKFTFNNRDIAFDMDLDPAAPVDGELIAAMRIAGVPEAEVLHLFSRVLRPGDRMIDGGANIGFFSLFAAQFVGKDGHVLAFEPGVNNLVKLTENIRINKATNIEVVSHPLWSKSESVEFHLCADGSKNSIAPHEGTRGHSLLKAVTLDEYATDEFRYCARLIKLDIEGAELAALQGGLQFLREPCPYIVMELNIDALPKFNAGIEVVRDYLRDFGYGMFLLHFDGSLPTYVPRQTKVMPNRLNFNVLFSTFDMVGAAWPEIIA